MEFGFFLPWAGPAATADHVGRVADAAEKLGYDYLAIGGHLSYPQTIRSRYPYTASGATAMDPRFINLGPLATLAWIGGRTTRIGLQTRVLLLPLYSPFVLAKDAATVDYLTGGRLVLGVGSGWMREEFEAMSLEFDRRGAMLDESIGVMRALWADQGSFSGSTLSFDEMYAGPRPIQDPMPIWLVGSNAVSLRRVATLGDGLLVAPGVQPDSTDYWSLLDRVLEEAGRSKAQLRISTDINIVGFETGSVHERLGYAPGLVPKDRDSVLEALGAWAAVGADHVNVGFGWGYEQPIEVLLDRVQWFAEEVGAGVHAL